MALQSKSLFLYGLQVTTLNSSIDFVGASGGLQLHATLTLGYYSLTGLCEEVARAMNSADPTKIYTCTANRNVAGGLQNRVTIATSGAFLSLLFGSGTRAASSSATLLGFTASDKTGATTYTGSFSTGTLLVSELNGYNYASIEQVRKVSGSVNVSASGQKESIVFQIQYFWKVEFMHEPKTKMESEWAPLMTWLIMQRPFDFTPEVTSPNSYYEGTLESTGADGTGLGYELTEELPKMPGFYKTGPLKFRKRNV